MFPIGSNLVDNRDARDIKRIPSRGLSIKFDSTEISFAVGQDMQGVDIVNVFSDGDINSYPFGLHSHTFYVSASGI